MASTVANANRDPKRRSRPYRPGDFMPRFERQEQPWEEQLRMVETMNRALGGRDERRKAQ